MEQAEVTSGIDWAENHHDVALVHAEGKVITKRRPTADAGSFSWLLGLIAEYGGCPELSRWQALGSPSIRPIRPPSPGIENGMVWPVRSPILQTRSRSRTCCARICTCTARCGKQ